MRRACDQCLGTDTQYECERGQCYAEHYQRQQEERWREEEKHRRQAEEEDAPNTGQGDGSHDA